MSRCRYTNLHKSNVVAAVSSVSARIRRSICNVSLTPVSPCVRVYTNIYTEITLYPLCPLFASEYDYLYLMFVLSSAFPCVRRYTNIYTEITYPLCPPWYASEGITLYPLCPLYLPKYSIFMWCFCSPCFPLCPRVYRYLHRNNAVSAVPSVSARIL